jgi:ABC-type maltose transport system permease subunit
VFACLILTAAPITALYLASQRFIISGMTSGGLKS